MNKSKGLEIIIERVKDFERNKDLFKKKGHGETNIRTNYIDIMFQALGWNMKSHYEVSREYSQKDRSKDGNTKKVDYCFKIKGKPKFFIEAKESSVALEHDKDSIYQAKRYAYSSNGKAPFVILTDFEEFRVFNVIKAPSINNTHKELLKNITMTYNDYVINWSILWDTFSKEAVENGSLDLIRGVIDKNTKTMAKDFLEQITYWRVELSKNVSIRNESLNVDEINEAVQRILDRLVFIRNLEDREIEPQNTLLNISKKNDNVYAELLPLFSNLNHTYNGLLYKSHFSENLKVDDKVIKNIIRQMCYPISPFQFDIIEPEILGRIYEKFLGSKIRLTESHRAKIEEKPEVRKAGGVFYTPEYIVEYIIKCTVCKKIEGLTPKEIEKIKILDPACGSGSFLLGAYSYILDYHQKWYGIHQKEKEYKSDWYKNKDGEITVRLKKRGDILTNNIFGVDIDKEATEVAIMSLYLKMLDNGLDKSERDLFFVKGPVLPDMIENVKWGNSLIDEDIIDADLLAAQEESEHKKIKPFKWENKFNKIFNSGGFDVVIGNPPWVFTKYVDWGERTKKYIDFKYLNTKESISIGKARQSGKINLYAIFLLKGIQVLNKSGIFSFIIPNTILRTTTYDIIRKQILEKTKITEIVDLKSNVFEGVTASTIIIVIEKDATNIKNNKVQIVDQPCHNETIKQPTNCITQSRFLENTSYAIDIFANEKLSSLFEKYHKNGVLLSTLVNVFNGVATGQNKAGLHPKKINTKCKKLLLGRDIKDYYHVWSNNWIEYDPDLLHRARNEDIFLANEKLIMQRIGGILITSYDDEQYYTFNSVNNLITNQEIYSIKYILACLNSKALRYYYKKKYTNKSSLTVNISKTYLDSLPLPAIDFKNPSSKLKYEEIVEYSSALIATGKNILLNKSEGGIQRAHDKIELIRSKIDENIYSLFGLSKSEIDTIENQE